jgi:hypothetical protein
MVTEVEPDPLEETLDVESVSSMDDYNDSYSIDLSSYKLDHAHQPMNGSMPRKTPFGALVGSRPSKFNVPVSSKTIKSYETVQSTQPGTDKEISYYSSGSTSGLEKIPTYSSQKMIISKSGLPVRAFPLPKSLTRTVKSQYGDKVKPGEGPKELLKLFIKHKDTQIPKYICHCNRGDFDYGCHNATKWVRNSFEMFDYWEKQEEYEKYKAEGFQKLLNRNKSDKLDKFIKSALTDINRTF